MLGPALALALLVPLAGCAGNGDPMSDDRSASTPSDSTASATPGSTPPGVAPSGRPASPAGSPVAPAGRPTPLSSTPPPTLGRPSGPPKEPTDNRPTDLVAGRITRGGAGPCFTFVDENDRQYALHGPDVGELKPGSFVTLRLAPRDRTVDCGPGIPMRIVTG